MTEQKLLPIDHCRHLPLLQLGGFFGGYACLCRGGILGSSQTMNCWSWSATHSLAGGAVCCCICCVW